jgi:hypothetical protein
LKEFIAFVFEVKQVSSGLKSTKRWLDSESEGTAFPQNVSKDMSQCNKVIEGLL